MAYARRSATRSRARSTARGSTGYKRAPARTVRRSASRSRPATRRVTRARAAPAQRVVVELVYRDASEVARPQGVETSTKSSKPKL